MGVPVRPLLLLAPLAALAAAQPDGLGFDPADSNGLVRAASIYFAPENEILFRMRDSYGNYREFERGSLSDTSLWSVRGWHGLMHGNHVLIESGRGVKGGTAYYIFENGRLVEFGQKGKKHKFGPPRPVTDGGAPYYFVDPDNVQPERAGKGASTAPKGMSKEVQRELKKKWAKSGRLRWPFENPNENGFLYLSLALLSTALFFFAKPIVRIIGGVCFVAASAALVMTASRGSFLAFAFGLVPAFALQFRKLVRSKTFWIVAGIVLATAVGWFATHELRLLTRGFTKKTKWSNETRIEMWKTAPQMMAEAPKGWGGMHVNQAHAVGRAYGDWYDDLSTVSLSGSLVNDHLTRLVGYSNLGRFVYLFLWFGLLALMGYTAVRTKRAVALGVFMALAVAGWFNAVLMNKFLWSVPAVAAALFLAGRPWRSWRLRTLLLLVVGAAVLAAGVLGGIVLYGRANMKRGYPIRVSGGQVLVKGESPDIWIVDDGKALGGVLSCRDIRRYYFQHPAAPALGYVCSVHDLPRSKCRRLVLAGDAGVKWLDWLREMADNGINVGGLIPDEVVFISPIFVPSELPEPFIKSCKVTYVIGEFVAQYFREAFTAPPEGHLPDGMDVIVVRGMELYIPNWMQFALGD